jgi:hypothetical protein
LLRSARISASNVLVTDLRPVSFLIGLILHDLQPAVGQEDAVRALSVFILATFFLAEFGSRLGVLDFVRVLVVCWFL